MPFAEEREEQPIRRVLFASHACYLDDSNGAAVASRAMMEALARSGFAVEAVSGTALELHQGVEPADWLAERGIAFQVLGGSSWSVDARGLRSNAPPHLRLNVRDVPVTLHRSTAFRAHEADDCEREEFLSLYETVLDRFRPDVVVNYGGDVLAHRVRSIARARGVIVVFALHNFNYNDASAFATADAVIVASRFAADHYRTTLGLNCTALPYLIDNDRVRVAAPDPRYVTFVNPSYEKGVYVFARVADELGRRRPDVPLLVVEGRGSERTLADCGIDLRAHGNVHLMGNTRDPREFWGVTRLCLAPSLWRESQGLVAVEAMMNGIPVVASDRGALPETLGAAGVVLPLPERLTPFSRDLPSAEEVAPWVETVIRIWDDPGEQEDLSRRSLAEAGRWDSAVLAPLYAKFFHEVRAREHPSDVVAAGPVPAPGMKTRQEFGSFLNRRKLLGVGAEIGVQNGYFARQVLDQWEGKLLYLIDVWQQLPDYEDVANVPPGEQVHRLLSAIRRVSPHWRRVRFLQELSENAARMIPDGSLDWVYIDANHEFTSVVKDLTTWAPKVREGGVVAGHDYLDGVLLIDGVKTVFDVRRAVHRFFEGREIHTTEEAYPTWFLTATARRDRP